MTRQGFHLFTRLQNHLPGRPTNRDASDGVHRLEHGSHESLLLSLLRDIFALRSRVTSRVDDARYPDAFVQHIGDPCRLETLHLQPGDLDPVIPFPRLNHLSVLHHLPSPPSKLSRRFVLFDDPIPISRAKLRGSALVLHKVVQTAEAKDVFRGIPVL